MNRSHVPHAFQRMQKTAPLKATISFLSVNKMIVEKKLRYLAADMHIYFSF